MSRLKVLVSAYACEPYQGSEPGVGWNWIRQIARFHDVWVLTRSSNRKAIEEATGRNALPNAHWIYIDLPPRLRFWKRGRRGVHLYYYLWQICAYFKATRMHSEVRFDLAHHVTLVLYWLPSMVGLLGVPFVLGPVGGGDRTPPEFYRAHSFQWTTFEWVRNVALWAANLDPLGRLVARRAAIAFGTTTATARGLMKLGAKRVRVLSQVGLPEDELALLGGLPIRDSRPFRCVSIGGLLPLKGLHLGLKAFSHFQRDFPASEYWIIGDGPERRNLKELAEGLGVTDKVRFWGEMPRSMVFNKLPDCDVLLHPSLHDSGGIVCAEAMAAGRPVVCLNLAGPGMQVTEETGYKVSAITPEQVVFDMTEAVKQLADSSKLRRQMGEAARQRARNEFHWDKKGNLIAEVYEQVISAK